MDTRELIAYALIAFLVISIGLAAWHLHNKRKDRRRAMRGFRR